MSAKFIKGAFVELAMPFRVPLPNVIAFQFNPEKIVHTFTVEGATMESGSKISANPTGVPGSPTESFSFELTLHAADPIMSGTPVVKQIAEKTGVATRIAALEMLLFPTGGDDPGLLGSVSAALAGGGSEVKKPIPASVLPWVLFVWGPSRIVPVRLKSLTISELLFDDALVPTHATVSVNIDVIRPEEFGKASGTAANVAKATYKYTHTLRQALAIANLANAIETASSIPLPL